MKLLFHKRTSNVVLAEFDGWMNFSFRFFCRKKEFREWYKFGLDRFEIVRCKNARFFFLEENIEDIFEDEFDYNLEEYSWTFKRNFRKIEKVFESCVFEENCEKEYLKEIFGRNIETIWRKIQRILKSQEFSKKISKNNPKIKL